mmetsp:Transcript_52423/g.118037  ORF Transcript_52423/g.118037 Transcript_52423/m.118037 type:complete len:266 (-) Transcript_52423:74-871(-)
MLRDGRCESTRWTAREDVQVNWIESEQWSHLRYADEISALCARFGPAVTRFVVRPSGGLQLEMDTSLLARPAQPGLQLAIVVPPQYPHRLPCIMPVDRGGDWSRAKLFEITSLINTGLRNSSSGENVLERTIEKIVLAVQQHQQEDLAQEPSLLPEVERRSLETKPLATLEAHKLSDELVQQDESCQLTSSTTTSVPESVTSRSGTRSDATSSESGSSSDEEYSDDSSSDSSSDDDWDATFVEMWRVASQLTANINKQKLRAAVK